jgi:hypothetical protein
MSENKLTFIENELKKFNVTDSAIAELSMQYMPLVINGIDDKEGLKAVNAARKIVKGYRIDVDKRRKELNADALEYQRRINGEAKRITALLEPIETHLANEEKKIEDELERIKREKEAVEAARYQERVKKLTGLKFMFDGIHFYSTYLDTFNNEIMKVSVLLLKQLSDEAFNDFYDNAKHYFEIEEKAWAEKKAREDAERKAIAEERARLDAIAREQAAKDAALKAEEARIGAAKLINEQYPKVIHQVKKMLEKDSAITATFPDGSEVKIQGFTVLPEGGSPTLEKFDNCINDEEKAYRAGFHACFEMVLDSLDSYDSNKLAKFSVWDFIERLREDLINLYKK